MSRGQIARWLLEEVGVDYVQEIMEYGAQMKSSEY
jgi:glutathione S-transferase